jgi:hypothetical protein
MNSPVGLIFLFASALLAQAQGSFTNLDFESANVSGYPPRDLSVPISAAFPGWVGDIGGTQVQQMWYDDLSLGGSEISITDSFGPQLGLSFAPLQGKYSALLFGGVGGPATISQTGLVPTGMVSVAVEMWWSGAAPIVTLGGQTIAMAPAKTYTNFTLYAGNIGILAGQTATLSFTAVPPAGPGLPSMVELDNIIFSKTPAPPPCSRTATATAIISNGSLVGVTVNDEGCGYANEPTVWILGGGGSGATAYPQVRNGEVTEISIFPYGGGYTNPPSIYIAPPNWSQSLPLAITNISGRVTLTWPTNLTGFTVQSTTNLVSPAWTTNLPAPVVVNGQNTVTNAISGTQQFYRLSQ